MKEAKKKAPAETEAFRDQKGKLISREGIAETSAFEASSNKRSAPERLKRLVKSASGDSAPLNDDLN
jgi:hypothetical protein